MLSGEGKSTKNNHPSCQNLLVSSVSMTTEHRFPLTLMTALKLRALEHPAAQVRTGGLPSIPRRTGLLVRAQTANQGREALMVAVGATKMGM
uniref:Uncharacterized protein n=1 Tax=Arundo donax TaxID=35708 RepID=A0A0A9HLL4_ARUDO